MLLSSLGTDKTSFLFWEVPRITAENSFREMGREGEAYGFCPGRIWLCSSVAKLLAQRYTAESWGCVVWIFRVESFALGIWAENRSLGIPVLSIGSWFWKEIRNSIPRTEVCLYQETLLCPEIGSHLRVASCPFSITLDLGVWITPAFVGSEKKQRVENTKM